MKTYLMLCVIAVVGTIGCTRVVVQKDPSPHDKGFRYNRPKPYLFIGPAAQAAKNADSTSTEVKPKIEVDKPGGEPDVTVTTNNFIKVSMSIQYLPDYNEEYSIKLRPGIGVGTLNFKLEDGWNLTSVGMQTDQKIPELLNSVANLVGAVGGLPTGGVAKKSTTESLMQQDFNIIVDTRPDVPLGFYEPIIATDPAGRKSLFGWRYVGFMPFTGCPVDVCAPRQTITCDASDLWGIVATPNSIKFQRLADIQMGLSTPYSNPYRYMNAQGTLDGPAPPPSSTQDDDQPRHYSSNPHASVGSPGTQSGGGTGGETKPRVELPPESGPHLQLPVPLPGQPQ